MLNGGMNRWRAKLSSPRGAAAGDSSHAASTAWVCRQAAGWWEAMHRSGQLVNVVKQHLNRARCAALLVLVFYFVAGMLQLHRLFAR